MISPGGFTAIFVPDAIAAAVSDAAWVRAMLEAETALAGAAADEGLIAADAARAVEAACGGSFDAGQLAVAGRDAANPVVPLVKALRAQAPDAHYVATSQDILDTAAMLVARRARAL